VAGTIALGIIAAAREGVTVHQLDELVERLAPTLRRALEVAGRIPAELVALDAEDGLDLGTAGYQVARRIAVALAKPATAA
jgi:hypothetical protein